MLQWWFLCAAQVGTEAPLAPAVWLVMAGRSSVCPMLWWADHGWVLGAHPAALSLPSAGQGRGNTVGDEKGRSLSNYRHGQNGLGSEKLIYCQSIQSRVMRNLNVKTPSPHPSLRPRLSSTPDFPPSSRSSAGEQGRGVVVGSSHVALPLIPPLSAPAPAGGPSLGDSSPRISPAWLLPTC